MSDNTEPLRVEFFGSVRPNQSWAVNFHLKSALSAFDIEYQKNGGIIGSFEHGDDREAFAKNLSEWIFDEFKDNPDNIRRLETTTKHYCKHLPKVINVSTETDISDTDQLLTMPFYEPN